MNLLKDIEWRALGVKIIGYALLAYAFILAITIIVVTTVFLNIDTIKHKVIDQVNKATGGELTIGRVQAKLNDYYVPELIVDNINFKNNESVPQFLRINHVDVALDYSMLWRFEPIFNKIEISGSNLDFVLESNNALYLNNIKLTDGDNEDLADVKSFDFDIERFILNQEKIHLNDIEISFEDKRVRIPKLTLDKVEFSMSNGVLSHHDATLSINSNQKSNNLQFKFNWVGNRFQDIEKWKHANLNVMANYQDSKTGIESSSSIVTGELKNGMLQDLLVNFDLKNFKLLLNQLKILNMPKFDGALAIKLHDNTRYTIQAESLYASSATGVLFDNSIIDGEYLIGKSGYVELSNTNLIALNNILSLFSGTRGLLLNGVIKQIKYDWQGTFAAPSDYSLSTKFNNLSLISKVPALPSLNNVSGMISLNKQKGNAVIELNNSKFDYNDLFFVPYEFNSAMINANWSISESGFVAVNLESSVLHAKDFSATAQGKFSYDPNNSESPSYIDMTAHLDKISVPLVADHLPRNLPIGVHNWLKMALLDGVAESGDLILRGPLGNFPFADNSGVFYITANVINAKLLYGEGWAQLDHIYGKFILSNTNITILGDKVDIKGNPGDNVKAVIPDYTSESGVELLIDAQAHGSTANFMRYLASTPIDKLIDSIPEKSQSEGQGDLKLHLAIPFNDLHKTRVNGTYHFIDNRLNLVIPSVPWLTNVNGDLEFTHYGLNIKHITANALNSNLTISAITKESEIDHPIRFNVEVPNLDYRAVAYEYLPFFAPIIEGYNPTNIKFTIDKHGLNNLVASSDLRGVAINAPSSLALQFGESRDLQVKVSPSTESKAFAINWHLGNQLHGVQYIGNDVDIRGSIAVGNHVEYMKSPDEKSLMTVNANIESVNLEQWIAVVGKLATSTHSESMTPVEEEIVAERESVRHLKNPFPIQIRVATNHMLLGKQDFGVGVANVLVAKDGTSFNMYTPITSGYGNFDNATKLINLTLDKYMIYKKRTEGVESVVNSAALNFVNGDNTTFNVTVPDINLKINNIFLQNHNLGSVSAYIHQNGRNLYLQSGLLSSQDYLVKFKAVNYCFGCNGKDSYVNLIANADISNLGNLIYNLDFGRLIDNGSGNAKATLQWNGGFQDFRVFGNIGEIKGRFKSGNIPNIQTGALASLFKVLDLQGLYKAFMDPKDLFKSGYFFNTMNIDLSLLTNRLNLDDLEIYGPLASTDANGKIDIQQETLDVNLAVRPHIGFAVAVAAGVATLNPLIGLGVYGVELISGGAQDKLVSFTYRVKGSMNAPQLDKTDVQDNIIHNINSSVNVDYGL